MKKIVIKYGLIAGAIVTTIMGISAAIYNSCSDIKHSELIGYGSMLLSFAFIFVAVKVYRDKHNAGAVSFGKAFLIGLYISLIASTMYVATWAIEYKYVFPDFLDKYSAQEVASAKASGKTQAAIDAQLKQMAQYMEMYKNPVYFTLLTYAEILPVGLVVSLLAAAILRKKVK